QKNTCRQKWWHQWLILCTSLVFLPCRSYYVSFIQKISYILPFNSSEPSGIFQSLNKYGSCTLCNCCTESTSHFRCLILSCKISKVIYPNNHRLFWWRHCPEPFCHPGCLYMPGLSKIYRLIKICTA